MASKAIAYLFVAVFLLAGPFVLTLVLVAAVRNVIFIHNAIATDGTILELRVVHATRNGRSYAPVFRFTADDGQTYILVSNNSGSRSSFVIGQRVRVLFAKGHPESAKIDSLFQLWAFEMIGGAVGGAFSVIPATVIVRRLRRSAPQP